MPACPRATSTWLCQLLCALSCLMLTIPANAEAASYARLWTGSAEVARGSVDRLISVKRYQGQAARVSLLDDRTGAPVWTTALDATDVSHEPAISSAQFLYLSSATHVFALSAADGAIAWQVALADVGITDSALRLIGVDDSALVLEHRRVAVRIDYTALDPVTGELTWEVSHSGGRGPVGMDDNRLLLIEDPPFEATHGIRALDTATGQGDLLPLDCTDCAFPRFPEGHFFGIRPDGTVRVVPATQERLRMATPLQIDAPPAGTRWFGYQLPAGTSFASDKYAAGTLGGSSWVIHDLSTNTVLNDGTTPTGEPIIVIDGDILAVQHSAATHHIHRVSTTTGERIGTPVRIGDPGKGWYYPFAGEQFGGLVATDSIRGHTLVGPGPNCDTHTAHTAHHRGRMVISPTCYDANGTIGLELVEPVPQSHYFKIEDGQLIYEADFNQSSTHTLKVRPSDDTNRAEPVTVTLHISNTKPVCMEPMGLMAVPGQTVTGGVTCSDLDGDPLQYIHQHNPDWGTVSVNEYGEVVVSIAPDAQLGTVFRSIRAYDGNQATSSNFAIEIVENVASRCDNQTATGTPGREIVVPLACFGERPEEFELSVPAGWDAEIDEQSGPWHAPVLRIAAPSDSADGTYVVSYAHDYGSNEIAVVLAAKTACAIPDAMRKWGAQIVYEVSCHDNGFAVATEDVEIIGSEVPVAAQSPDQLVAYPPQGTDGTVWIKWRARSAYGWSQPVTSELEIDSPHTCDSNATTFTLAPGESTELSFACHEPSGFRLWTMWIDAPAGVTLERIGDMSPPYRYTISAASDAKPGVYTWDIPVFSEDKDRVDVPIRLTIVGGVGAEPSGLGSVTVHARWKVRGTWRGCGKTMAKACRIAAKRAPTRIGARLRLRSVAAVSGRTVPVSVRLEKKAAGSWRTLKVGRTQQRIGQRAFVPIAHRRLKPGRYRVVIVAHATSKTTRARHVGYLRMV